MFDEVEASKITLSDQRLALVRLTGEDLHIWQPITRSQFEHLIDGEREHIERCLLDTVTRSGLRVDEIDAVVRTGGSAQIPSFIHMLGRIFGPERVVLSSVFSGVTAGLAIRAATLS
jgi:molecular chaperone DnaK (HSP70)